MIREMFNDTHGFDVDEIGCWAGESDSDGDGKLLYIDDCPNTPDEYKTQTAVDGCHVSEYDIDVDGVTGDLVSPFGPDQCVGTSDAATRTNHSGYGDVDAFGCWYGDDDSDNDGVRLYLDRCLATPEGESVMDAGPELLGCSASQRDEDGDGVMSDVDQCPETPSGEEVQTDGEYAGCSLDERVNLGDTSAVLQKNMLWIIIGSVLIIGIVVMATMVVLRRGNESTGASQSMFMDQPAGQMGYASAPAAPQVLPDYTHLPGGGTYSTGAMGETIYNAPDGSNWQMQADSSFTRIN